MSLNIQNTWVGWTVNTLGDIVNPRVMRYRYSRRSAMQYYGQLTNYVGHKKRYVLSLDQFMALTTYTLMEVERLNGYT